MMNRRIRIAALVLLPALAAAPGHASEPEAKAVAREANCPPGKVEVVMRRAGTNAETIYKIACTGQQDAFVTVRCTGRLCILVR